MIPVQEPEASAFWMAALSPFAFAATSPAIIIEA